MDIQDDELSYSERREIEYNAFLKQDAIKLELNKTYLQESYSWAKKHYKIIFIDEKIAVGIVVWSGIYNSNTKGCGGYEMFKVNTGEKYNDCRLEYRLKSL